jgi:two-component system, OmpR family, response regulator
MAVRNSPIDGTSVTSVEPTKHEITRSVLIVEDDPLIQLRLETLLESAGYSVTCVCSAQQAREAIAVVFFPIVIIDRTLADDDGITLCKDLRIGDRPSRVFVLVLSARDSQLDIGQGMRAGADAYLSKRTSDAELLAYLDAAFTVARFSSK